MTSNYVFAANKAGMETIDRAKIDSIIFELTSNSFYCKTLITDNEQQIKIAAMKSRLTQLVDGVECENEKMVKRKRAELERTRASDRICVHVDMDAFFVSVELLSRPHLRELPVAVSNNGKIGRASCRERV